MKHKPNEKEKMKSQTSSEKGCRCRVRKTDLLLFRLCRDGDRRDLCVSELNESKGNNNLSRRGRFLWKHWPPTSGFQYGLTVQHWIAAPPSERGICCSLNSQQLRANQTKLIEQLLNTRPTKGHNWMFGRVLLERAHSMRFINVSPAHRPTLRHSMPINYAQYH